MSVSLLLGLVYLISELLLKRFYEESRNAGTERQLRAAHTTVTTAHETAVDLMHQKRLMMD